MSEGTDGGEGLAGDGRGEEGRDQEKAALKALAIAEGHRTVERLLRHIALTQIAKEKKEKKGQRYSREPIESVFD